MKINEVENRVGITKKNIRFYEEQGLIHPERNQENGYRNYSEDDVEVLLKIKLLRKLSLPIEEIRKLETNHLTLSDCMERHLIYLSHEERNLDRIKEICQEIARNGFHMYNLDADRYLQEMKQLEEGGMRFMNIEKKDTKKRKKGTVIAAVIMTLLMFLMMGLVLWGNTQDPLPIGILLIILAIPGVVVVGVVLALKQRLKEIEGGEEDEASKY